MNAEGNLKTPVLRRKRGSACVFWRTDWIKGIGRAPFSIEVSHYISYIYILR